MDKHSMRFSKINTNNIGFKVKKIKDANNSSNANKRPIHCYKVVHITRIH